SAVCMLCGRADVDPNICGHMIHQSGIHVHWLCLVSSPMGSFLITARGAPFLPILRRPCSFPSYRSLGATIACAERGCERSFHLPCAQDGECITQFFGQRRSFCSEHRPRQEAQEAPPEGTNCLMCLEPVGDTVSYHTMVCPACRHTWFHRGCIQVGALPSPCRHTWCSCPGCRNILLFFQEMSIMGIQIPVRPWQLILCSSCAAEGTHRCCSHLNNTTDTWECNSCAGLGTGKRQSIALHHTGARQGLAVKAQGSFAGVCLPQEVWQISLQSCRFILITFLPPLTASCAEAESASPSTPETEQETSSPHSCEDGATSEQLRGRRGRRPRAAQRAESDSLISTRQRASGSSWASPAAARRRRPRQRGRSRTRSRSPLQGQTSRSQSWPRRRHASRRMPASGERSGTQRSTRSATLTSSRSSRMPGHRGRSRH
uniref:RING-type domain-containing protein n=1 Tax=Coturnix japonica TaxID=93934 RepID=A0A8C2SW05_COTJA